MMLGRGGKARVSFEEAIELGLEPALHEDVLRKVEALDDEDGDEGSD